MLGAAPCARVLYLPRRSAGSRDGVGRLHGRTPGGEIFLRGKGEGGGLVSTVLVVEGEVVSRCGRRVHGKWAGVWGNGEM